MRTPLRVAHAPWARDRHAHSKGVEDADVVVAAEYLVRTTR